MRDKEREHIQRVSTWGEATPRTRGPACEPRAALGVHRYHRSGAATFSAVGDPDDGGDHLVHPLAAHVDLRSRAGLLDPEDLARHSVAVAEGSPSAHRPLLQGCRLRPINVHEVQHDALRRRGGGHGVGDAGNADRRLTQELHEGRHRPARPALRMVLFDLEAPGLQRPGDVPERLPLLRRSREADLARDVDEVVFQGFLRDLVHQSMLFLG
jgi:hypothetical protein